MASLQVFDAASMRISDLAGFDATVNLRRLTLRNNRIENLQPLSEMTKLGELESIWGHTRESFHREGLTSDPVTKAS